MVHCPRRLDGVKTRLGRPGIRNDVSVILQAPFTSAGVAAPSLTGTTQNREISSAFALPPIHARTPAVIITRRVLVWPVLDDIAFRAPKKNSAGLHHGAFKTLKAEHKIAAIQARDSGRMRSKARVRLGPEAVITGTVATRSQTANPNSPRPRLKAVLRPPGEASFRSKRRTTCGLPAFPSL